jgi:hypothetical protein
VPVNPYTQATQTPTARPLPPSTDPVKKETKKELKAEQKAQTSGDTFTRVTPPAVTARPSAPQPPSTTARPTPPSSRPVPPSERPVPPAVIGNNRPVPPAVIINDRPVPPPVVEVHVPRYYYSPRWPVFVPSNPRPLPQIDPGQAPAGARRVDINEVNGDAIDLLAEKGRLRDKVSHMLWPTTFPELNAAAAKSALAGNKTIWLGPDSGMHMAKTYTAVTSPKDVAPMLGGLRNEKLNEMQGAEDQAAANRRSQWNENDIQNRQSMVPAFNSVYDMGQLNMNDYMVSGGTNGKSFNRLLITAMNVYAEPSTKRELAERWHANPNMSTAEFNQMANSVVANRVQNLAWNAGAEADIESYLGQCPVPGLRYPDTEADVQYNIRVIQEVASKLPFVLGSAVSNR